MRIPGRQVVCRRMALMLLAGLAAGLMLTISLGPRVARAASPIVIDDFQTGNESVASWISPGCGLNYGLQSAYADGTGILGGERAISVNNTTDCHTTQYESSIQASVSGGAYSSFRQFSDTGPETIWWDGTNHNSTTLNTTGLGGVDLTASGLWNSFSLLIASNLGVSSITVTVYTDGSNYSTDSFTPPFYNNGVAGTPPSTPVILPFTDFTTAAGTGASFTNVGAITMTYTGTGGGGPFFWNFETHSTILPVLSLPSDITTSTTNPGGTTVTYTPATATDHVDGPITPTCTPTSGSNFAIGTTTVNCSVTDSQGNTASGSFKVTVNLINSPPTVSAGGPYSTTVGVPASLTGSASDTDGDTVTVQWSATPDGGTTGSCSFGDAASLTSTVTCTAVGSYTLTLTANDGYTAAVQTTAALTVGQATPALSFTPNPATITYGTPLGGGQLDAAVTTDLPNTTAPVPGSFSYRYENQTTLASGTATVGTVLPAGSYTLTATFTPTDTTDYTQATATADITVDPAGTTTAPANATARDVDPSVSLSATVTDSACPPAPATCPTVGEGAVTFTVTDAGSNQVGSPVVGSVSNGSATATFSIPANTAPGSYTITASYHDPAGLFADSSGSATLSITPGPPSTLTLQPGNTSGTVGTSVTETATVHDAQGYPVSDGTPVQWLISGPGSGSAAISHQDTTTTGGQAVLTYSNTTTGVDTVTATAGTSPDTAGNAAGVTWTPGPPATLTLAPGDTSGIIGSSVIETATVEDQYGNLVADGTTVGFSVTGANTAGGSASTTNGQAAFSYSASLTGSDTLVATAQGGSNPSASATITWTLPASTPWAHLGVANPGGFYIYGAVSTGATGGPSGLLTWRSPQVTFLDLHFTALVASGPDATLFGTATLANRQAVTFRLDAVAGVNTVRLRLSDGYDSGVLPVMSVRVTP